MAGHLIEYAQGPKCPRCGWDQFDDWWHVLNHKERGKLKCECGTFHILVLGGELGVRSSCWGVKRT